MKKKFSPVDRVMLRVSICVLALLILAAGCTVIVYDSPVRRARGLWEQHWHSCPYGGFWGNIYWEYMWYRRYPYYSWVMYSYVYPPKGTGRKISKKQLQNPTSSGGTTTSTKVTKRKVVETEKEKPKKVIKKKKDV